MGEIRPLGRLTVLYRGLPIGTVGVGEAHYGDADDDAPTPPDSLAPFHRPPTDLVTTEFRPLPGYAAVADAIRSAGRAFSNYGFIGPAADPASDERAFLLLRIANRRRKPAPKAGAFRRPGDANRLQNS